MKPLDKLEKRKRIHMSIETMLIRIPLISTPFSKKSRAMMINLHRVNRVYLEPKRIELYPGQKTLFGEVPIVVRFDTHARAIEHFNVIETFLKEQGQPQHRMSKERMDTASVDPLAMAALQDFEEQKQLK
jgi:hypothetical protein